MLFQQYITETYREARLFSMLICIKYKKSKVVFPDEATFHMSGIVNSRNCLIWGYGPPNEYLRHERNVPTMNV
jgi:hypothetical protein